MQLYLRLGLRLKEHIAELLEFNQSQWIKPFVEFNSKKRIEVEKYDDKEGNWNFDKTLIVCQILLSIYILMFYYKQIFDLTVKDFS